MIGLDISSMSYSPPGRLPRIHRWAGLAAVVAAVVFIAANSLWGFEQPDPGASGPELVGFYTDVSGRIVAGALLTLVSIAALVVFASALRSVIGELEGDSVLADVAFGGALLTCAAGLGAETINMGAALRAHDGELTESLAQAMFEISYVLGYQAAGVGCGLFAVTVGAAALRARALLPRWLAVVFVAVGVALITPLSQYLLGPSFLLLLVLGVLLLRGSGLREASAPA